MKKFNNTRYLSNKQINIGINKIHNKEYQNALEFINSGLENAIKVHSRENIELGNSALVEYHVQTHNYKETLLANKNATKFHDSIVNVASKKNMIAAQIQYETPKRMLKLKTWQKKIHCALKIQKKGHLLYGSRQL